LEGAHGCLIDRHHPAGVIQLAAVIGRREEGDETALRKEHVPIFHHLMGTANKVKVVTSKELFHHIPAEYDANASVGICPMTTAWTIRSRLNPATIRRPASLNSLPDLSDNLEIESRPYSGSSTLFISPGDFELWGQNSSDLADSRTYRHRSNISVSFLGSCIRRQYRSSFMLSDDQVIGVTRCETFQPEDAKADVRVNLSLQGPPNRLIVSGHHHSQSAPSLIPNNIEDNRDWACLMLTTDRPRDSELVGYIGSRNYFTNSESGAPYFHRRITPMQKEEEYVFLRTSPAGTNTSLDEELESQAVDGTKEGFIRPGSFTVLMTGAGSDAEPSTERVEKDTCPLLSRHQESRSSAVSPHGHISLSEKEPSFPIIESQSPCTQQISDYLPSTERSESIIHLKRTKSETSLSAQTPTSIVTPWLGSMHPKSSASPPLGAVKAEAEAEAGVGERSTPQVDNTLSLHTDFEEEEEGYDKGSVGTEKEGEKATTVLPTVHHATASKAQSSDETASAPSIPFVNPTNGVAAPFRGVGGLECVSRPHGQVPIKSTILYTSLQMNTTPILRTDTQSISSVPDAIQTGAIDVESEGGKVETLQDLECTELDPIAPLPRKRKRALQQDGEEVEDGMSSQTDDSQTAAGTSTQVSEQDYYAGGSEQSVGEFPLLLNIPLEYSSSRQQG
uniref:IRS-type PTB domain-containing protein n=1 Tax=Taenia asiatica TaxID=60517 RepID=A0A158R8X3_TAEAS